MWGRGRGEGRKRTEERKGRRGGGGEMMKRTEKGRGAVVTRQCGDGNMVVIWRGDEMECDGEEIR